jgi:hypothetical protein
MYSCMLPNVCCCVAACSTYLEVWRLYWRALLCLLYLVLKSRPVCPMYALLQSGHERVYTPERVKMSRVCGFRVRWCSKLLFVR